MVSIFESEGNTMQKMRANSVDMLNGPLLPSIWVFSLPLMLTNLLQMLFQAADTVVVGRFAGQQALAAVGATGSLCFLLIALFNGLSMGSNVLIARYIGAGNHEKIEKSVHTSIAMSIYCGLFLVVAGFFLSRPMLELMSTPSDIIDMSELYMRIYFVSAFFGLIYTFGSSILRSKGDTKRPLFFLFVSGMTNVVLNLVFVIVFQMSVAGVALATVISQALAALLVCITLMKEPDATHLDLHKLRIDRAMALEIIRIGVPAGLQGMAFSLSNVVVQSSINSFDSSVIVAGNSAKQQHRELCLYRNVCLHTGLHHLHKPERWCTKSQACQEHLQSFDGADHFKRHADGLFGLVLRRIAACFLHQRPCCRRSRYASPVLGVHVPFPQRHPRCLCFFPARHGLLLFTHHRHACWNLWRAPVVAAAHFPNASHTDHHLSVLPTELDGHQHRPRIHLAVLLSPYAPHQRTTGTKCLK